MADNAMSITKYVPVLEREDLAKRIDELEQQLENRKKMAFADSTRIVELEQALAEAVDARMFAFPLKEAGGEG
jgi:cell division septum initiation protein DivIVA